MRVDHPCTPPEIRSTIAARERTRSPFNDPDFVDVPLRDDAATDPSQTGAPSPPQTPHDGGQGTSMRDFQRAKRFFTDAALLVAGDVPAAITIAANLRWLPIPPPVLGPLNAFNALTGALGLASEASTLRDCLTNPEATRTDKAVDAAHFANSLVNTGASMIPLFVDVVGSHSPAAIASAAGQMLGTLGDVAKLAWDAHRGGGQSAQRDADEPRKLIMDRFEKCMGRVPMALANVGTTVLLGTGAAGAAGAAAAASVSFGGAFAAVYGVTQARKSHQLRAEIATAKRDGQVVYDMPRERGGAVTLERLPIDRALASATRAEIAGIAQATASSVLVGAGVMSSAPLAIAGLTASSTFAVAAVATEMAARRADAKALAEMRADPLDSAA